MCDHRARMRELIELRRNGGDVDEDGSAEVKWFLRAGDHPDPDPLVVELAETYTAEADEVTEEHERDNDRPFGGYALSELFPNSIPGNFWH